MIGFREIRGFLLAIWAAAGLYWLTQGGSVWGAAAVACGLIGAAMTFVGVFGPFILRRQAGHKKAATIDMDRMLTRRRGR